jgi:hypothetical protein
MTRGRIRTQVVIYDMRLTRLRNGCQFVTKEWMWALTSTYDRKLPKIILIECFTVVLDP